MTVQEFLAMLTSDIECNVDAFIYNVKHLKMKPEQSFCEWIKIFIAWMEWASDEDCKENYGE